MRRVARLAIGAVAVLAAVPFLLLAPTRVVGLDRTSTVVFQVQSFFYESVVCLGIATVGALAVGVRRSRSRHLLAALWLVAAVLIWPARPWQRIGSDADGPSLRVATSNVYVGNHQIADLLAELAATDPDLVVLQEVTPYLAGFIESSPLADLPHRYADPRDSTKGSYVLSRHPIEDPRFASVGEERFPIFDLVVGTSTTTVIVVHTTAPTRAIDALTDELRDLGVLADRLRADGARVALVGDFNISPEQRAFRDLLDRHDLVDAHIAVGKTLDTTWPTPRLGIPPLVALDHVVVTPDIGVDAVRSVDVTGTDHRAVIADLTLPAG